MSSLETPLGACLRRYRKAKGYTKKQVAHLNGISDPDYIEKLEKGHSSPPLKLVHKLASFYELDSHKLFEVIMDETMFLKKNIHSTTH